MLDVSVLPAFLLAVMVILVTPGPDMAFMIATGINQGRGAAVRGAFGVTTAMGIWVLIAATGLGVALAQVPAALDAIRLVGAAYLGFLAVTTWRRAGAAVAEAAVVPNVFRRGFVVNITNPKVALFFVAFLPQFLGTAGASGQSPFAQILMLGLLLQLAGLATDLAIGSAAGVFRDAVLSRRRVRLALDAAAGTVYGGLAVLLVADVARG
ncbi:LysE family translocator [Brachybacterium saurashtrense]|uniref:LysE family translocator n=1 Tax=Brachybacterium saurashtrense TaxID=556288 RepID=A0A345YRT1_9MICO|nr:LysE family translocator [Brachybacterium saurashtrense]AXK46633.1 LysE family translocator [Brachybacterium saurashtrense]RRR20778.1 LysE family translocator [Brachybacterium saurashtrense]